MKCQNCGAHNDSTAKYCKKCGHELSATDLKHQKTGQKKNENRQLVLSLVALFVVCVLAVGAYFMFGKGKQLNSIVSEKKTTITAKKATSKSKLASLKTENSQLRKDKEQSNSSTSSNTDETKQQSSKNAANSSSQVTEPDGEKNLTKAGETLADYAGDWSFIKDNTGQLTPAGTGWASLVKISANSVNMTNGDDPNEFPINKFDWAPDEQGGLYSLWEDYDQAHPTFKLQHVRLNFHGDTYDAIKLMSSGVTAWYERGK
jgi:ribosomal protein L40E